MLYVSSDLGIREHLALAVVGDLHLHRVFPQTNLATGRGPDAAPRPLPAAEAASLRYSESLPRVICACKPADPATIVKRYRPRWIAADLGADGSAAWVEPLLRAASDQQMPVIGWCANPLAPAIQAFADCGGLVFRWVSDDSLSRQDSARLTLRAALRPALVTYISPYTLVGGLADSLSYHMIYAGNALCSAAQNADGRCALQAVRLGWTWRRRLETLSVPLGLLESEARYHWGSHSVAALADAFDQFRSALKASKAKLRSPLEEAHAHLSEASTLLRGGEPPMWQVLLDHVRTAEPVEQSSVVAFTTRSDREIFEFSVLAHEGMTAADLAERGIYLTDLPALQRSSGASGLAVPGSGDREPLRVGSTAGAADGGTPLLVGLPGVWAGHRVYPLLRCPEVRVMVYSHQLDALARLVNRWDACMAPDLQGAVSVLSRLNDRQPQQITPTQGERVAFARPCYMQLCEDAAKPPPDPGLWPAPNMEAEIGHVMGDDDDPPASAGHAPGAADDDQMVVVDKALRVQFTDGRFILLPGDEPMQIVGRGSGTPEVHERRAAALRSGDEVLFIQGQRKQSLYELLVSRLHRTPAIAIHLALVGRWHADLAQAYAQKWRGRQLGELLLALQNRGSSITTTQAIRSWITGEIICPDDAQDQRRLAEILGMSFVVQRYREIDRSAQRLRGLHRGLANRLNHWLVRRAPGILAEDEDLLLDEAFDEELGLSLRDFRDSLLLLKVAGVLTVPGPFYVGELCRLMERGTHG